MMKNYQILICRNQYLPISQKDYSSLSTKKKNEYPTFWYVDYKRLFKYPICSYTEQYSYDNFLKSFNSDNKSLLKNFDSMDKINFAIPGRALRQQE